MGFKRKPLVVTFPEDHELHGLEAHLKRMSVNQLLEVTETAEAAEKDAGNSQALRSLVCQLSEGLIWWNYEEEGPDGTDVAVDTDVDSLLDVDLQVILEVVQGWTSAAAGVSGPLAPSSSAGSQFQVELPPMVPLSPNLSNSSMPG